MSKVSVPKGTRDFLPKQVARRKYIFSVIEDTFKTYGYLPIETPTMENLSTLTGKYGEEGDRLLFKVLNNGDFLADVNPDDLSQKSSGKVISQISKRGLRYDLTVPFARFVVMHQHEIQLPFKRYQIQQVWRADRPQRGRYQEFYQCDADIVGSDSLMYEAELVQIYASVFRRLGIKVKILINNRKILYGLAEAAGITDKFMEMTISIDKLDKIGKDGVIQEMCARGIRNDQAQKVLALLQNSSLDVIAKEFQNLEHGNTGIQEIKTVMEYLDDSVPELTFDISLARGLNYYTGCILEVKIDADAYPELSMGSIGGGGRYDDLTGIFGLKDVSGVGVSFGAERIYDIMEELSLFPDDVEKDIQILFLALDSESHKYAFIQVTKLREAGIACDLYPEPAKMKKQMAYANARNVPFVSIIGDNERESNVVTLKNMQSGHQVTIHTDKLISQIKSDFKSL
ncbi:MAG TPA: histidine--tRNA ligase [Saprospiraceae bacterium]|nr:histidine--tRNA ligase [Saprospiraceae bacterium]HRO08947.1 histidine--tRNA ligase [Saprospiraceae bacterium]HRP42189.1 histidine--tRNA ligase [Saprospiraceae bacterium]